MNKDISKVKIKSSFFDNGITLDLFNPFDSDKEKIVKGSIIYGKNGSGKSTISKGFRVINGEVHPTIREVKCFDKNGIELTSGDLDSSRICIFDEEYVDKNVKLKEGALDTIVMLGPAADLTAQIERVQSELALELEKYEKQKLICEEYNTAGNVKSPKTYRNEITNSLKGDDNWAGRDKQIAGNKTNSSVREETYKMFVDIQPTASRSELIIEFNKKIKNLNEIRTKASRIYENVPKLSRSYFEYDLKSTENLLLKRIEKPKLSEREKYLFSLLEEHGSDELEQRIKTFEDKEMELCPFCLQPISSDYKVTLIEGIEKVLNKLIRNHRIELSDKLLDKIDISLESFECLSSYNKCLHLIAEINRSILEINSAIETKLNNPYEPLTKTLCSFQDKLVDLEICLNQLEAEKDEYNEIEKRKRNLVNELTEINTQIAYYDIKDSVARLEKQVAEETGERKKLLLLEQRCKEKETSILKLEGKRNDINIALESINACMKYIFFEENRLSLEYDGTAYKLLSRGKKVKPSDVSMGERNIIALSYFFTSILEGQAIDEAYKKDYLLIIDDPVSSFDFENRIGILSFLKHKLGLFLENNVCETKALILTHDIVSFEDIRKIMDEICDDCEKLKPGLSFKYTKYELKNKSLKQFVKKGKNEYTELVGSIYDYALQSDSVEDDSIVIGNQMRQVLEAFGTFEYKKGIADISCDKDILRLLPSDEYRCYFKNLMYRLVLHGGSHKEEQVKSMKDYDFFSIISDTEKKRTAKDVLCFMYLLNKQHIIEHLKNRKDAELILEKWCDEIKSRSVVI